MAEKSKIEWTPGPWSYVCEGNYARITCTSCEYSGDNLRGYCGESNARLIAAAPELVEALRDLCDTLGECGMTEKARAALAKAGAL